MKLRISSSIIDEIYMRELAHEDGHSCYKKIAQLEKAGRVEFDEAEVAELKAEADYWFGWDVDSGAGYVKAWRALYKQIVKAGA